MARYPTAARPRNLLHGATDPAPARARARPHGGAAKDNAWLFAGFILLLLVEYAGVSNMIPVLDTLRFSTLLCYSLFIAVVVQRPASSLIQHTQTKLLLAFIAFTVLSVMWAVVQWKAVQSIRPLVDYMVLFVLTARLIDRQSRVDALSWLFLGVALLLVARNIAKLTSGQRTGAMAAPYFMADGNDFAWGMVIMLPFILNLVLGPRGAVTRLLGLTGVACCILGVIGSGSRGAALGLGAAVLYYWVVISRRKALGAAVIAVLAVGVLVFAPSTYVDRLRSIGTYETDSSAMGRLRVWRASVSMAIDRPLGAGAGNFSSAYGRYYVPSPSENTVMWAPQRWLGAHSIYFKVLGEYGILGLLLIFAILRRNLRDNAAVRRWLLQGPDPAKYAVTWPALLNMAIVGYAVCGIFLGGINYPHLFVLSALTVSLVKSAGIGPSAGSTPTAAAARS